MVPEIRYYRLLKQLKNIAKLFKISLRLVENKDYSGEYNCLDKTISICIDEERNTIISSFFHELGHFVDHSTGKYPSFYKTKSPLYKQRMISLRAERSADEVGKRLCKAYFPNTKYEKSYLTKAEIKYNREYYKDGRKK